MLALYVEYRHITLFLSRGQCPTIPLQLEGGMSGTEERQLAVVVGRAIAKQRKRCGLTQNEVAEKLGVSFDVVSRTERGIVMPGISRLMQLAAIFDCETAELLTETSTRSTDQASRMADLISDLNHAERLLIMSMVEQLVAYMKQK